jgi:hypothetical protein
MSDGRMKWDEEDEKCFKLFGDLTRNGVPLEFRYDSKGKRYCILRTDLLPEDMAKEITKRVKEMGILDDD